MRKGIFVIILVFLFARLFFLFDNAVVWDGSVYVGMGKYLFSSGKSGLWEPSRPIVWPIFLGFLWKTGLDPVFFGRILTLLFSLGVIYLTYALGKEAFNERTGLIAAFFLAFSPAFFYSNISLLTAIPSTFFALLGVLFFIRSKHALSGFLIGIASMIRFYQAILILSVVVLAYLNKKKIEIPISVLKTILAFLLTIMPYLIFNKIVYNDPVFPLAVQVFLIKNTGWAWYEPFTFYFVNLFRENFLVIFSVPALLLSFKEKSQTVASAFITFLLIFSLVMHKEMRFAILFFPYLYILSSAGISYFLRLLNKKTMLLLLILITFLWAFQTAPKLYVREPWRGTNEFQRFLETDIDAEIWTSNPEYLLFSDKKADYLLYYPAFDKTKLEKIKKINRRTAILLNSCDIPCNPASEECPEIRQEFLDAVKDMDLEYYKSEGNCEKFIAVFSP